MARGRGRGRGSGRGRMSHLWLPILSGLQFCNIICCGMSTDHSQVKATEQMPSIFQILCEGLYTLSLLLPEVVSQPWKLRFWRRCVLTPSEQSSSLNPYAPSTTVLNLFFSRQGLAMLLRLAWNSLYSLNGPRTHSNPFLASQMLAL